MTTELTQAFSDYKKQHGHRAAREVLERVAGVTGLSEVPGDKAASVVRAFKNGGAGGITERLNRMSAAAFAKFNARKPAGAK